MNRTAQDFRQIYQDNATATARNPYPFTLSRKQLAKLFGTILAAKVTDQYVRLHPTEDQALELWLRTDGLDYERQVVELPEGWGAYTVDAIYPDNSQEYTQAVLAKSKKKAAKVVQAVAYEGNHSDAYGSEDSYDMLDITTIEPGLHY